MYVCTDKYLYKNARERILAANEITTRKQILCMEYPTIVGRQLLDNRERTQQDKGTGCRTQEAFQY